MIVFGLETIFDLIRVFHGSKLHLKHNLSRPEKLSLLPSIEVQQWQGTQVNHWPGPPLICVDTDLAKITQGDECT